MPLVFVKLLRVKPGTLIQGIFVMIGEKHAAMKILERSMQNLQMQGFEYGRNLAKDEFNKYPNQ
jgi:hypothetical protein